MELTKMERFKALNDKHTNLRECEGLIITPVAYITYNYNDGDGKEHTVLVIKDGKTGQMFKTEVQAFIEKFLKYDESFGDCSDEEKPDIVIIINTSKKGNRYVNFDLAAPETEK